MPAQSQIERIAATEPVRLEVPGVSQLAARLQEAVAKPVAGAAQSARRKQLSAGQRRPLPGQDDKGEQYCVVSTCGYARSSSHLATYSGLSIHLPILYMGNMLMDSCNFPTATLEILELLPCRGRPGQAAAGSVGRHLQVARSAAAGLKGAAEWGFVSCVTQPCDAVCMGLDE